MILCMSAWIDNISADSRTKSIVFGLLQDGRCYMAKLARCSGAIVNLISEAIDDSYNISFKVFKSSFTF